ncbi:autotransporter domain-containing protein [Novosphingobium sp. ZW T3_23]|uniref:autotransporter domain-containing protein n=1 Tax=Novosphingobium sp. ZW T3_23 TaxID=3378084 RepID=UPI003854AF50
MNGGATFDISGTTAGVTIQALSGGGNVALGGKVLTADQDSNTSFAGVIAGTGSLTKAGTGTLTLTLTGVSTYEGGTVVGAGTLALSGGASIAASTGVTVDGGATFDVSGTTAGATIRALSGGGNVALGSKVLTVDQVSNTSFAGIVAGTGSLIKAGTGTLTLTSVSTYGGGTLVGAGTLALSGGASLSDSSGVTVNGGATFDISGTTAGVTIQALSGAGNVALGGKALTADQASSTSFAGVIAGTGSLTKAGMGTLTLTGASTYGGSTVVDAGTLALSGGGSIAVSTGVTVDGSATFDVSGTTAGVTIRALSGAGNVSLGGKTLTIDQASATSFAGTVSGIGGLTKQGTGTLTLSGVNTYGGDTVVAAGALALSGGASLSGSTGVTVDGGATFDISGTAMDATIRALNGAGNVALGGKVLTVDQASATSFAGVIGGTGGLTKQSAGTLTLTGVSTYDGGTTVDAGTLALSGGANIANSTGVTVNNGATFDISGTTAGATIRALSGAGDVSLGGKALTVDQVSSTSFAGAIAGNGTLTKQGTGTLTLTGDSSAWTGTTTISVGKLVVGNAVGGALGGDVTVDAAGTLGGSGVIGGSVRVDGTLSAGNSPGTLTIAGNLDLGATSRSLFELNAPGVVGGTSNDLIAVGGDLTLGGALDAQVAAAGYYRLFDYGGDLLAGSFADENVTSINADFTVANHQVQTGISGQVNLFVRGEGQILQFWDGADTVGNGIVNGGGGAWSASGTNWTGAPGEADFNGTWQGSGSVAVFGGANGSMVTVSGTQSFDTLQFSANGYALDGGALAFAPASGTAATVQVDGGVTATIGSTLTDGASATRLNKTGSGTLVLSGNNLYSGGTTVSGGTLVGNAAAIRGDLRNAGVVIFDQASDASFAGSIAGLDGNAGTMVKRGAGELTLTGASALDWTIESGALVTNTQFFTGNAAVTSGATLTFSQAENGRYDGRLSGAGTLSIDGGAGIELTGDSSAFSGELRVVSGRLVATGAIGGTARIGAGGVLAGNGGVGTTIIGAGGIASPGNSIGTITVNGNLVFEQGSFYEVEVDPLTSGSDQIRVTGTATLNGGTVAHIGFGGNYRPSASYTILTAAGGVTGTFDAVNSNFAFLTPTLGYTANTVTLTLKRNDVNFTEVAASANQRAVAGATETLGAGNAIYDALVVADAATARAGFDGLSGEVHASLRNAMVESAGFIRSAALDRLRNVRTETGVGYWMRGVGGQRRVDGNGNAGGLKIQSAGVLMGVDAMVGETVQLGVFGGWLNSDVKVKSVASSADVDSWSIGFYAGGELGRFNLRAGAALGAYSGTTKRGIAIADFDESAKADVGGSVLQGFGEIGYRVTLGDTQIEPVAGIAHVVLDSKTAREQGDAAALQVASGSTATTFTTLGARLAHGWNAGSARVVLDAAAGWRHAFGTRRPDARVAYASNVAQSFTISGAPIAEDMLSTELGLGIALSASTRIDLRYTGDVAGSASNHGGNATFAWRF